MLFLGAIASATEKFVHYFLIAIDVQ